MSIYQIVSQINNLANILTETCEAISNKSFRSVVQPINNNTHRENRVGNEIFRRSLIRNMLS